MSWVWTGAGSAFCHSCGSAETARRITAQQAAMETRYRFRRLRRLCAAWVARTADMTPSANPSGTWTSSGEGKALRIDRAAWT